MSLGQDPHSYANFGSVQVSNYALRLTVDFKRKILYGSVDITASVLAAADSISLDIKGLAIESVQDLDASNAFIPFTIPANSVVGSQLCIALPAGKTAKDSVVRLRVNYATSENSGGIQWLDPEQTQGKKFPFVYTQCEAILARTLLPCQDTPAVKTPYTAAITCPAPLTAVCSGIQQGSGPTLNDDGSLTYDYLQEVPIPAYLIAVVCGRLFSAPVGRRSKVWSERELLDRCVFEFSQDTENYISIGEELTKVPYSWGQYDMVILPGAFPYGGMENPNLTFLSSSLLAGDRSLTNVVCHEISHSWAGNFVTNSSWSDFWLNEGFCVYLERLILGHLHSEAYRYFEILIGYNDLKKTVNMFGPTHEFTKLRPNLEGMDPDDAFSKIPYEKGSLFLLSLEQKVGGSPVMLRWLSKFYGGAFKGKSVSSEQMRDHFLQYMTTEEKIPQATLDSIDWNAAFYNPGLPEFDPSASCDKKFAEACDALAEKWIKNGGEGCSSNDLSGLLAKQTMFFLDRLQAASPLAPELIDKLDALYGLSSSSNVEIHFRYIMLCLLGSHRSKAIPQCAAFLAKHGRGLYVKPMYTALNKLDHEAAVRIYHANRTFYHSVIRNAFDGPLEWH